MQESKFDGLGYILVLIMFSIVAHFLTSIIANSMEGFNTHRGGQILMILPELCGYFLVSAILGTLILLACIFKMQQASKVAINLEDSTMLGFLCSLSYNQLTVPGK